MSTRSTNHAPDPVQPLMSPAKADHTVRRVKRLTLAVMVACLALGAAFVGSYEIDLRIALALGVVMVGCWAIISEVGSHVRGEGARRASNARAARLEGARLTASAMQDQIANKLSLTVGYSEFLANDERLPDDLRELAQKALMGARAAAQTMSELKRVTNADGARNPEFLQTRLKAEEVESPERG